MGENGNIKERIIKKIKFVGKWAEIWFKEDSNNKDDSFDFCVKSRYLWDAVHESDLFTEIMNNGFKNKKLILIYVSPNWELKSIKK